MSVTLSNSQFNTLEQLALQGIKRSQAQQAKGKGRGDSWLEAIARAMGNALGKLAAKLVNESQTLQDDVAHTPGEKASKSEKTKAAEKFQADMAQFQADSQMFSILSNAFSTGLKSIGEGTVSMARKQ